MSLEIYHNPRCSKSRQTLALIEEHGEKPTIIRYLDQPPSAETLAEILNKLNISAEQLIRKTESIYKENYKGKTFTEAEWIDIMVKHPKLIERPIVIKGNKAVLGRPPENVIALL